MYGMNDLPHTAPNAATERLEMRLAPADKGLLARAAQIEGMKLSQFVLAPAEVEQVRTSAKGYKNLLDALAKPPKPSKALIAAMRDYESAGIKWR
jgi:uncharacterized protein (DUF1778 family)